MKIIEVDFKKKTVFPTLGYSALDIAHILIHHSNYSLTPMKLHKLIYFCEGWALALTNHKLILESFEVGEYGPTVSSVSEEFNRFGNREITSAAPVEVDDYTRALIERVLKEYGNLSSITLSQMCHNEESPWFKCQKLNLSSIPSEEIRTYFYRQLK